MLPNYYLPLIIKFYSSQIAIYSVLRLSNFPLPCLRYLDNFIFMIYIICTSSNSVILKSKSYYYYYI
jgi:hypothetical protein